MRIGLLAAGLVAVAGVAHADTTGMLPGGASIQFNTNRLFLHEQNNPAQALPIKTPDSLWYYFNVAHCQCSRPNVAQTSPYYESTFAWELSLQNQQPGMPIHRPLEIWVGSNCNDNVQRPMLCHRIDGAGIPDIASIATTNGVRPEVPTYDLMNPVPATMNPPIACTGGALSAAEWAIADSSGNGTYDYFVSQAIDVFLVAPTSPTQFEVSGGANAINLSWTAPTASTSPIQYWQALCQTQDGRPALTTPPPARYQVPSQLCGAINSYNPTPVAATVSSTDMVDAGTAVTDKITTFDPAFICGEVDDATATSMRITGLANGTPYSVMLLAIDKAGNASATYFTTTFTPAPVTDFWQDLHNRGSQVQGGFCLIADTFGDDHPLTQALRGFRDDTLASSLFGRWLAAAYYGSLAKLGAIVRGHPVRRVIAALVLAPLVAVALAWHALTLPGLIALVALGYLVRRRRLRLGAALRATRLAAPLAFVAVLAISPRLAHAQRPYWEDATGDRANFAEETSSAADEPRQINWHVGLRVGAYTPQIDAQLNMDPGPYKQMFGGYAVMPMLDVDRIVWRGFGQLGLGGTVGFMGKSAHAWKVGTSPTDPNRERSPGDTTSFRLIPFALTAIYRFTWLDDEHGIPLVPYARGGLAYYVWWMKDPNNNFSQVCTDPQGTMCSNRALGASAGVQANIGLAWRAESIDKAAARSMRESGLDHAGFYVELQYAHVGVGSDGYSSPKKLAVGATTWFAGVDFEF